MEVRWSHCNSLLQIFFFSLGSGLDPRQSLHPECRGGSAWDGITCRSWTWSWCEFFSSSLYLHFFLVCQVGCFSLNEIRDGWRVMSVWAGLIISNLELSITQLSPGSPSCLSISKTVHYTPELSWYWRNKYLARNQEPKIVECDDWGLTRYK